MPRSPAAVTGLFTLSTLLFTLAAGATTFDVLPRRSLAEKCSLILDPSPPVNARGLSRPTPLEYSVFMAEDDKAVALSPAARPKVLTLVKMIEEIAERGGHEFTQPASLRVALKDDMSILQSTAYAHFAQLNLPLEVLLHDGQIDQVRFVIAHEVGHVEYDMHLRDFAKANGLLAWEPEKAIHDTQFASWLWDRDRVAQSLTPTSWLGVSLLNEEEQQAAGIKLFELNRKIHRATLDTESLYHKLYVESVAFHEVLADAWALVDSGDPKAWTKLASRTDLDYYIRDWEFSDFGRLLEVPGVYERILNDPHVLLMKVRHQLWIQFYRSKGMLPGVDARYDAVFLKTSANALAEAQFGLVRARATATLNPPSPKEAALALLYQVERGVNKQMMLMMEKQLEALRQFIVAAQRSPQAAEKLSREQLRQLVAEYDRLYDLVAAHRAARDSRGEARAQREDQWRASVESGRAYENAAPTRTQTTQRGAP